MIKKALRRLLNRQKPRKVSSEQIATIRQAMLAALGADGALAYPKVAHCIGVANDEMALWYARSDLMNALASLHGERFAQKQIVKQTALFRGVVSDDLMASGRRDRH